MYSSEQLRTGSSLDSFFNFNETKKISNQWYDSRRMPVHALHAHSLASI